MMEVYEFEEFQEVALFSIFQYSNKMSLFKKDIYFLVETFLTFLLKKSRNNIWVKFELHNFFFDISKFLKTLSSFRGRELKFSRCPFKVIL